MDQIVNFVANLPMEQILAVIGALSMIATFTPTPVDDGILAALRKVLNLLAFNWGEAENARKPGDGVPREPKVVEVVKKTKRKFGPRR